MKRMLWLAFVALLALPRALWAWDAQAVLDVVPTAALVQQQPPSSPWMQAETTEVSGQAALSHSQTLAEGLSLSGTAWGLADSLPSGSPFETPPGKVDIKSRILELKLVWEVVPGMLIWDIGKKVIHPSSGFFRTPLNVISHGPLGNAANINGAAVGTWEEGWIGTDVTLLLGNFTISNFFSPRMLWSSQADSVLQFFSLPQNDFQNLTRLDVRLGNADMRFLGLVSSGGPGSSDPGVNLQLGAGVDTNIGDSITVRAEVSAANSQSRLTVADPLLATVSTDTVHWAPQALVGATWTNAQQLSLMAEYYYNGGGFAGSDYTQLIRYSQNRRSTYPNAPDLLDQFGTLSAGRHYGFVRISGKLDDTLTAAGWTQVNLQDLSGLTGILLTLTHDTWSLNGSLMNAWGTRDTEAGLSPLLWRIDLELTLFL
ncbi:MAG TPA: hypothetical protein VFB30_06115 [Spirochaetia bacterium]|nr:hypothetical protein [Spirochaetia bacterium]